MAPGARMDGDVHVLIVGLLLCNDLESHFSTSTLHALGDSQVHAISTVLTVLPGQPSVLQHAILRIQEGNQTGLVTLPHKEHWRWCWCWQLRCVHTCGGCTTCRPPHL